MSTSCCLVIFEKLRYSASSDYETKVIFVLLLLSIQQIVKFIDLYFQTDLFDLKGQYDLLTVIAIFFHEYVFAGSLESANSSILAARRHFKEVVGEKIRIL